MEIREKGNTNLVVEKISVSEKVIDSLFGKRTNDQNKIISIGHFVTGDFWRSLFKAVWLFFPAIVFLLLTFACFWTLSQGKDLMIITWENGVTYKYFIIALFYWVYMTWYSTRIVAKAKYLQQPEEVPVWTTIRVQGPRILAFTCLTIVTLAFFQLDHPSLPRMSTRLCYALLILSFPYYFLLYRQLDKLTNRTGGDQKKLKWLNKWRFGTYIVLLTATALVMIFQYFFPGRAFWPLISLMLLMQPGLVLLLIIRSKIIAAANKAMFQKNTHERKQLSTSSFRNRFRNLVKDEEDKQYYKLFLIASAVGLLIYIGAVFFNAFAREISSFPLALLAFSVLLGAGNFISACSVLQRFNFHIVLIGIAIIAGKLGEPHYTKLKDIENANISFANRQTTEQYFASWLNHPDRQAILNDPAVQSFPVYLVLADGGASRSGYWVASALARMEDETAGKFSKHLFALSGASGGSVGNATFYSLLRNRNEQNSVSDESTFLSASKNYLKQDFLSYTLARLLGPDMFRYIIPTNKIYDRAAALAHSLETAPGHRMHEKLSIGFTNLVSQKNQTEQSLPILCINTTRMQDGKPAVISTASISGKHFNGRLDLLNCLKPGKDIKLSSAVVLGASFPYVSPAGRIDGIDEYKRERPLYFVDGGYFDNSGAGVVNEMLTGLSQAIKFGPFPQTHKDKIRFHVLHITNEPVGIGSLKKVHPLINDVAAPIKTLIGSYGTQTSVNDLRLENFLSSIGGNYSDINLYYRNDENYSMNWVISKHLLNAMDKRLMQHPMLNQLIEEINKGR